ncbi:MAG TPA: molybdopterin-synthase adenylyltransferase MoeB [Actinomycetes bacterium]|nr:molybdopterin-synthase adenylyltransferase MoeB [Actinomycetes bacterium]
MVLPALVEPESELGRDEIARYSRHLIIPEFAMTGQRRLRDARVLLIGAGGLGSPNAMYLAAAGVGEIGLVDFDVVDASNLQRQVIHGTSDIGRTKLDSAADSIREINPSVRVTLHDTRLGSDNARALIRGYDLVVDGSDNFPTRYLVNDACVLEGKPYVWGSIFRFEGQASVFWAEHGPCYRCLYPEPPPPGMVPSCAEGGVLGVLCATVGSVQATEAVKLLTGIGRPLVGRLLIYDALEMGFKDIRVRKDPGCALCGDNPTITELIDYEAFCGVVSEAAQEAAATASLTPAQLAERLAAGERLRLVDVREPHEWEISRLPDAQLIPLGDLPGRLAELPQTEPIVVYCKTGVRSAEALALLKQSGFSTARHLGGGINAYARTVDASIPQY